MSITQETKDRRPPPLISVPSDASERIHAEMLDELCLLAEAGIPSCLDPVFVGHYRRVLELFDRWQAQRLADEGKPATCRNGCATCCMHWVEDVYSFEAMLVAAFIREHHGERIPAIVAALTADQRVMAAMDGALAVRRTEPAVRAAMARDGWDELDALLIAFYRLKRPCPLLDEKRGCMVYPVRPLTCRVYLSFHDRRYCAPSAGREEIPTFLLQPGEKANEVLDAIHFRYDQFDGDTSLRTMLLSALQSPVPRRLPETLT